MDIIQNKSKMCVTYCTLTCSDIQDVIRFVAFICDVQYEMRIAALCKTHCHLMGPYNGKC